MSKISKLFVAIIASLMLSGCSTVSPTPSESGNTNTSEEGSLNNSLELLSFKKVDKSSRQLRTVTPVNDKETSVEATVKNEQRDSFIDLVLYISWLNTQVVYNEGHGSYVCTSTTVYENNLWVTKISLDLDLKFNTSTYDCYVEIVEINFLHSGTERMQAALSNPEISKLTFTYNGYDTTNFTNKPEIISGGIIYEVKETNDPYVVVKGYNSTLSSSVVIPNEVSYTNYSGTHSLPVREIANDAFKNSKLTNVTIGNNVIKIGEGAFLKTSLNRLTIPSTVSDIDGTFIDETPLKKLSGSGYKIEGNSYYIPASDGSNDHFILVCSGDDDIPFKATHYCLGFYKKFPAYFDYNGFWYTAISPNEAKFVGTGYGYGITHKPSKAQINIPKTFTIKINNINYSFTVTEVADTAFIKESFESGTDVQRITFPDSIKKIGNSICKGCPELKQITFTNGCPSLKEISEDAFASCSKLDTINTLPINLEKIGKNAFWKAGFNESSFGSDFPDLSLPDTIKEIGDYAFAFTAMTFSKLPDNLEYVGEGAFVFNPFYEGRLTIPAKVKSIGDYAFTDYTGVSEIEFPDSLEYLGNYAFARGRDCYVSNIVSSKFPWSTVEDFMLEEVTLPNSIKSVYLSFTDKTKIKNIPESIETITLSESQVENLPNECKDTINDYLYFGPATNNHKILYRDNLSSRNETSMQIHPDCEIIINNHQTAYSVMHSFDSIALPERVKRIETSAFNKIKTNSINLNEGLEYIGSLPQLGTNLLIPASVKDIDGRALPNTLQTLVFAGDIFGYWYSISKLFEANQSSLQTNNYGKGKYIEANGNPYEILVGIEDNASAFTFHDDCRWIATLALTEKLNKYASTKSDSARYIGSDNNEYFYLHELADATKINDNCIMANSRLNLEWHQRALVLPDSMEIVLPFSMNSNDSLATKTTRYPDIVKLGINMKYYAGSNNIILLNHNLKTLYYSGYDGNLIYRGSELEFESVNHNISNNCNLLFDSNANLEIRKSGDYSYAFLDANNEKVAYLIGDVNFTENLVFNLQCYVEGYKVNTSLTKGFSRPYYSDYYVASDVTKIAYGQYANFDKVDNPNADFSTLNLEWAFDTPQCYQYHIHKDVVYIADMDFNYIDNIIYEGTFSKFKSLFGDDLFGRSALEQRLFWMNSYHTVTIKCSDGDYVLTTTYDESKASEYAWPERAY